MQGDDLLDVGGVAPSHGDGDGEAPLPEAALEDESVATGHAVGADGQSAQLVPLEDVDARVADDELRPSEVDGPLQGGPSSEGGAAKWGAPMTSYAPSSVIFQMISFITSDVPPPIGSRRTSRCCRQMSYSSMKP